MPLPSIFTFEENRGPSGKEPVAARSGIFHLPHGPLRTPIFMPVATQGALKGVTVEQLEELDVEIILGNTYHLGLRPGEEVLRALTSRKNAREAATSTYTSADGIRDNMDGIHFMESWKKNILTDSGGFQMVSLLKLAQITEEGVRFQSTHGAGTAGTIMPVAEMEASSSTSGTAAATSTLTAPTEAAKAYDCEAEVENTYSLLLRPEDSIRIQNAIGGDIMMQLDDVVHSLTVGLRVEEAAKRSIRWLDRCLAANQNREKQCIFGIVQGALNAELRRYCLKEIIKRTECMGYAIGGLSGGEAKDDFWRMVRLCTKEGLPANKPRYCMGVGYPEDILVCIALGVDMFDCVYACRTARFGSALTSRGKLQISKKEYAADFGPLDPNCSCMTCRTYTRSYLNMIAAREGIAATLLSYHNIAYLINLTRGARSAIEEGRFTTFVQDFFLAYYPAKDYPQWAVEALASVEITLL
ncbi:putative Queuine tRNA-ribosyltransferase [Leishmania naiffi]|uniref:Queuine tRNA-ribosyltransferase n=1 Tax=Leishmania naiffi TaxID=5678 RepID=A0AAW3C0M9_9TRYP